MSHSALTWYDDEVEALEKLALLAGLRMGMSVVIAFTTLFLAVSLVRVKMCWNKWQALELLLLSKKSVRLITFHF